MKRQWRTEELAEHWTLSPAEQALLRHKRPVNRLGLALQLKFFELETRFPKGLAEIPPSALTFVSDQTVQAPELALAYDFQGRSSNRHRQIVREFLGFRSARPSDAGQLQHWLEKRVFPFDQSEHQLRAAALEWCREQRIEPSENLRIGRAVRTAVHACEMGFHKRTTELLPAASKSAMDAVLMTASTLSPAEEDTAPGIEISAFAALKTGAGAASVKSINRQLEKLDCINGLQLPVGLFDTAPPKLVLLYRRRAGTEPPRELRRHPDDIRYTLLACFAWQRRREVLDELVELLIRTIHNIGTRAERRVVQVLLQDVRKVRGKNSLLYKLSAAALANPDSRIRDVLYPIVSERTLSDIVQEFETSGPAHRQQIQHVMRGSYSHHYRRILPLILDALEFRSNNRRHQPVIKALDWLRATRQDKQRRFPRDAKIPLKGIVSAQWEELVLEEDQSGVLQVNRIPYELCVLEALRERLRCREIWVVGAERFGNPDTDLPPDFEANRPTYYEVLNQPTDPEVFVDRLRKTLSDALAELDATLPDNAKVKVHDRPRNRISISPYPPLPEPPQLRRLKAELGRRWPMTSMLDVLKETDLRVDFTGDFHSVASREVLDRRDLQERLLLCLFGLGTNAGLKAVTAGAGRVSYTDLVHVGRRFIHKDALRAAIARVANAVFEIRRNDIWGEGTTACASDSKRMGAWDQNLMTEWHARYGSPGVMIYWHIEKRSLCVYSQLKRCSSSEAAAMIEGVLRHCTDMSIEKNYVDSHGQSEVAFGVSHILGFDLLPRLKAIASQKLYRPTTGRRKDYARLQPILSRPIRWDLIPNQYDEVIKYCAALRTGTADAEAILRRFTRSNAAHPTYKAIAEVDKAVKTIFLCRYLGSEALRREIHDGLNVVERWNGTQDFLY